MIWGIKAAGLAFAVFCLAGCTATADVQGQFEDGTEVFTGSAVGQMDGSGTLTVTSNRGRSCTGNFIYETTRRGAGNFVCADGSGGPFEFTSTGRSGVGSGRIGSQNFVFTFG